MIDAMHTAYRCTVRESEANCLSVSQGLVVDSPCHMSGLGLGDSSRDGPAPTGRVDRS